MHSTCGGFEDVQRGHRFRREPVKRTKVEVRVGELGNGKVAGKVEVTGEVVKGWGDLVIEFIWN